MAEYVCKFCGGESPNDFVHNLNHREIYDGGLCTKQDMALRHLRSAIERPSGDLFKRAEREANVRELNCEHEARARGLI